MKKRNKIFFSILFTLVVLVGLGIEFITPHAIVKPWRRSPSETPEDFNLKYQRVDIQAKDGAILKAYDIQSSLDSSKGTVIFLHGISSCKERMLERAALVVRHGYNAICYDARAHGESEGKYCTYGKLEKQDVQTIIDRLKSQNPKEKIIIWGNSLGGAVAIQALEIDKRIDLGVIESTFTSMREIVFDYQVRLSRIKSKELANHNLANAAELADFNPDAIQPIRSVEAIHQPIFIAHGDKDTNISMEYGRQLYEALATDKKEFHIIEGATHHGAFHHGGAAYHEKIMNFVNGNL